MESEIVHDIEYVRSISGSKAEQKTQLLNFIKEFSPTGNIGRINKRQSAYDLKNSIIDNLERAFEYVEATKEPTTFLKPELMAKLPEIPEPFYGEEVSYIRRQEREQDLINKVERILRFGGDDVTEFYSESDEDTNYLINIIDDFIYYYSLFDDAAKEAMPRYQTQPELKVTFQGEKIKGSDITISSTEIKKIPLSDKEIQNYIEFYDTIFEYMSHPYVSKVQILSFPGRDIEVPKITNLDNQFIRDSSTIIKGVDIGYKLPTITYKSDEQGKCGPYMLAEILKDTRATFTNEPVLKNTPKVTVDRIVAEIDKLRGYKSDPAKGYKISEMQHVAEKARMPYFYVIDSFGEVIHRYNSAKRERGIPGCVCFCNSLHFTHVPINTVVGISAENIVPKAIDESYFKEANVHLQLESEKEGQNAYYLPFPVNDLAVNHLKTTSIAPNIIRLDDDDKSITCFSIGSSLYKFVENMNITLKWLESTKMKFHGQSLPLMAYEFWQKSVRQCHTSPLFYKELKTNFRYCHIGSISGCGNIEPEYAVYVDCTKCFTSCIEEMQCGLFEYTDEIEPYNPNMPIHPCGFYFTSAMGKLISRTYWPHFGEGTWYLGAAIIEFRKYFKVEIMSQIIPSKIYAIGELSNAIQEIFKHGGKLAANSVIGMLTSTATNKTTKTILTDSVDEMAYYINTRPDCEVSRIEVNGRNVFKITSRRTQPNYQNYLPIAKTCHQWANLKLFKKVMELKGLDALIAISTDCLIFDRRKVDLSKLPLKEHVEQRGIFAIENKVYKPITKTLEKPRIKEVKPPLYPIYNKFTEIPLDKSIFCNAPAGMGKSFILREFIERLEENKLKPLITSATGITALNLHKDAITTHSALGLKKDGEKGFCKLTSDHTHWISDEFYYLDSGAQHAMMQLRQANPKLHMVLFGSNIQLSVNGRMLPNQSSYMAELCHANQLVLSRNYRFDSSPRLAELCAQYIDYFDKRGSDPNLQNFPEIGRNDEDLAIVATNRLAQEINAVWLERNQGPNIIGIVKNSPLISIVYVGMPIIKFIKTKSHGTTIVNGQFFIVQKVDDGYVILEYSDINRNNTHKYVVASFDDLKHYGYAWALTCHYAQGSTIKRPYTVYQSEHVKKIAQRNPEWLYWHYVAYSRGIKIELLNVKESPFTYECDNEPTFYEDL